MEDEEKMSAEDFNVDERVLCSDDACIGLVGPDRCCKVCGGVYTGVESLPDALERQSPMGSEDPVESVDPVIGGESTPNSEQETLDDPDERICCSDDTCIGLSGPNGICGTCGKSA